LHITLLFTDHHSAARWRYGGSASNHHTTKHAAVYGSRSTGPDHADARRTDDLIPAAGASPVTTNGPGKHKFLSNYILNWYKQKDSK